MIKIDNVRFNGIRHEWTNMKAAHVAFKDMIVFELGYGGRVIALSEDKVTVRTNVMGCVDETTFSGAAGEVRPLIEFAALWCEVQGQSQIVDRIIQSAADALMNAEPGRNGVQPLLAQLAGPMFVGTRTINGLVKGSVLALLQTGGHEGTLPDLSVEELIGVLFMALSGEMGIADALAATA